MDKTANLMKNKKEKTKNKFSESEKRLLIAAIKNKNHIWDKSHKLHSNRNAMRSAWREVANEIGKTDEDCKQNWRSILDSKRYYKQKRKASKKSGSGCDLEFLSDESQDPWEFSEDLHFLTEASDLRSTCSSQLWSTPDFLFTEDITSDVEILSPDPPILSPKSNMPTYSYTGRNKNTTASSKNVYLNEMRAGVSKVADVMTTLVDLAKTRNESSNKPFLDYIDSLLLKLPQDVAEDVKTKIVSMVHQEISAQKLIEHIE